MSETLFILTIPFFLKRFGITLACGHREAAERLVRDVEVGLAGRDTPAASAELETARGLLLRDAEPVTAAEHFARAGRMWAEIGRPYEAAGAVERQGRALAATDPSAAIDALAQAVSAFGGLSATADVARCEHALRELGLARPARGRRGYGEQLSPREHQVAELLAGGATNQRIADTLFLSPRTVEHHVANVLRKLGTSRKRIAAVYPGDADPE